MTEEHIEKVIEDVADKSIDDMFEQFAMLCQLYDKVFEENVVIKSHSVELAAMTTAIRISMKITKQALKELLCDVK